MSRYGLKVLAAALSVTLVVSNTTILSMAKEETGGQKSEKCVERVITQSLDTTTLIDAFFDAQAYADENPSVKEALGYDKEKLLDHYFKCGIDEGRKSTINYLVDIKKYKEKNTDLQEAFGNDYELYLRHYIESGIAEGREGFGTFNPESYMEYNKNLSSITGTNVLDLLFHYMQAGRNENRVGAFGYLQKDNSSSSNAGSSSSKSSKSSSKSNSSESSSTGNESNSSSSGNTSDSRPTLTPNSTSNKGISYRTEESEQTVVTGRLVDETGAGISNATITATSNSTQARIASDIILCAAQEITAPGRFTTTTDENGNYSFTFTEFGTFHFVASGDGLMEMDLGTIPVTEHTTTTFEAVPVLSEAEVGANYFVAGQVVDVTTGNGVANVSVEIRSGFGSTSDIIATVSTDASGNYSAPLSRGYYTATFKAEGYVDYVKNVISAKNPVQRNNVQLTSTLREDVDLRVVLTWGENPSDLDSHITGVTENNSNLFHVYFGNKKYLEDGREVVSLDVDDVTSYGPETVTVIKVDNDIDYRYSVLDFSHQTPDDTLLANSGATVNVYQGSQLVYTYSVPSGVGYIWNVFDIVDGAIVPLNYIHSTSEAQYYGNQPRNLVSKVVEDVSVNYSGSTEAETNVSKNDISANVQYRYNYSDGTFETRSETLRDGAGCQISIDESVIHVGENSIPVQVTIGEATFDRTLTIFGQGSVSVEIIAGDEPFNGTDGQDPRMFVKVKIIKADGTSSVVSYSEFEQYGITIVATQISDPSDSYELRATYNGVTSEAFTLRPTEQPNAVAFFAIAKNDTTVAEGIIEDADTTGEDNTTATEGTTIADDTDVEADKTTTDDTGVEVDTTTTDDTSVEADTTTVGDTGVEADTTTTDDTDVEADTTIAGDTTAENNTAADDNESSDTDKIVNE